MIILQKDEREQKMVSRRLILRVRPFGNPKRGHICSWLALGTSGECRNAENADEWGSAGVQENVEDAVVDDGVAAADMATQDYGSLGEKLGGAQRHPPRCPSVT